MTERPKSLWHHRDFGLLWGGQTVSELGSAVTVVALPLLAVLTLHATPFEVGTLEAATTAAFLLVGLPAGAILDRRTRRPVLMASDLGRAVLFGSIPVAAALGWLTLLQLYVVTLLGGVLRVFFDVSYQSYLPALVDREQLVEGNTKLSATEAAAQVAGPSLAGALVGAVGAAATMAIDAVSYLVSFVSLAFIRRKEPPVVPPEQGHPPMGRAIREGLSFVIRQPLLARIAGCTALANLGSSIAMSIAAVYLVRVLHLSPAEVGLVFAVEGAAGVVGAVSAGGLANWLGLGPTIVGGSVLSAAGIMIWPFAGQEHPLLPLMLGAVLFGLGVPVYNVNQLSLRQAITPSRLLGRMNASIRFVVWGVMPIGGLIGGLLGATIGVRETVLVGALVGTLAVPWIALSPVRSLRVVPEPVADD